MSSGEIAGGMGWAEDGFRDVFRDAGWRGEMNFSELPTANLYLTMLHKLGVEAKSFAGSTETLSEV